ncbi:MAG: VOC family protein [Betaproteobacteria bacterium]|nr:VOC family protein [Betaproteobacteria bacterium]
MFTRIDHVMICVPDLVQAIAQYRKLGFSMHGGGAHPGKGTHNAIAMNNEDYLELLAVRDVAEYAASRTTGGPGSWNTGLTDFIAAGGGIRYIAIQSDDLAADVAAMCARGLDVSDVTPGSRRTPAGLELKWQSATLGAANALPIFFIQHLTPLEERRKQVPAGEHPNRVYTLERTYIVCNNLPATAALYARVLGLPQPQVVKGTVIMSDMAVFQLGEHGLGVVEPYADGPAAAALKRRGPGPFQALYRTKSSNAAEAWIKAQGLPPLQKGVRNTGEVAMLATPEMTFGAYVGFVGMA